MPDPGASKQRFYDWLEVHGPDCPDPHDPDTQSLAEAFGADAGLQEHYRAIEQADAAVAKAFADVPVPEGLQQRVLARLQAAGNQSASRKPDDAAANADRSAASDSIRRARRRRWIALSAGAAVAATVLLAWVVVPRNGRTVAEQAVLEEALTLFLQEAAAPPVGILVSNEPSPHEFPYSRHLRAMDPTRWRLVERFLGQPAAAFDVEAPWTSRVTLYVVPYRGGGFRQEPPPNPKLNTRNCSAAAWQEGALLYVLVVAGGPEHYRAMLRASGAPIT